MTLGAYLQQEKITDTFVDDATVVISGAAVLFLTSLAGRKAEAEKECEELRDSLSKKFRSICDRSVTVGPKSFFPPAMRKVYDIAKDAKRAGRKYPAPAWLYAFVSGSLTSPRYDGSHGPLHRFKRRSPIR